MTDVTLKWWYESRLPEYFNGTSSRDELDAFDGTDLLILRDSRSTSADGGDIMPNNGV
jgi:hypothetical protein